MPKSQQFTEDRIKNAASVIRKTRPAYGALIDFYREVFLAQEESRRNLDRDPVTISKAPPSPERGHDIPLLKPSEFSIDYAEADRLLEHLCSLARRLAPKLAESATALETARQKGRLEPRTLFNAVLRGDDGIIHETGESCGIPVQDLAFFAYGAIAPSIFACASRLERYLKDRVVRTEGYCPICGSRPDMAFLDNNGARHLVCGFCAHEWSAQRMGCVFCGNSDEEKQNYFYHEEEKEYRVDLCDHCRRYMKLVDLRELPRDFYPRLEQVCSLHLDMEAKERGYRGWRDE
jgi:FdhE protein